MNDCIKFLAFLGLIFLSICVVVVFIFVYAMLKDMIVTYYYNYRMTHLQGKKPKAECYCEYCYHYNRNDHSCKYMVHPVDKLCFCWRANPMDKKEYNKRLQEGDR